MNTDLSAISTRSPKELDKQDTKAKLQKLIPNLQDLQNLLYADGKHALLVVFQGLDASGKDGVIKNVMGTLNPMGIKVKSFKAPTEEELAHDFLWRIHQHTPEKGMIQVFNRSHYEDVLVTRIHKWIDDETVTARMNAINNFEQLLVEHNNTIILKFYLHVSKEEQQERLKERTTDPTKHWKHNANDQKEAALWDDYRKAYEDCFDRCNIVPWTIVPADQNWYKEFIVANAIQDALSKLNLQYPNIDK
jgi:PPK2 family polyphosphate:nucleotide phosphotransferase